MAALACFFVAVVLVVILEIRILKEPGYAEQVAGITTDDLKYRYWEWDQMILGISAFMSIFEGNSSILTVYAEADKPKQFAGIVMSVYVMLALAFASWGILSYYAFGNTLTDIILIILPSHDGLSIAAKIIYSLNICGSYILMIQPIFSVIENYQCYQNSTSLPPQMKFVLGRLSIVLLTLLASAVLPNVNSVLQLNGAVCAPFISCIIPFLCYYRAYSVTDSSPVEQAIATSQNEDDETNREDVEEAQPLISKAEMYASRSPRKSRFWPLLLGTLLAVIGTTLGMAGMYQTVRSIMILNRQGASTLNTQKPLIGANAAAVR